MTRPSKTVRKRVARKDTLTPLTHDLSKLFGKGAEHWKLVALIIMQLPEVLRQFSTVLAVISLG